MTSKHPASAPADRANVLPSAEQHNHVPAHPAPGINLSRRNMLMRSVAVLASTAAIAAPSIAPAAAEVPNPDAELLALAEQCIAAEREFCRANEVKCRAEETKIGRMPRRPKVLRIRPTDRALGIPICGNGWTYYDRSLLVDPLRRERWCEADFTRWETDEWVGSVQRRFVPSPEARARADEIVAAFDAWSPKKPKPTAAHIRALDDAEKEERLAGRRANELQEQLAELQAKTLAGIAAKARVLQTQWSEIDLSPGEGSLDCELAASIVRDVLRLSANA